MGGPLELETGVPTDIGNANAAGAATDFADRLHVHNHPSGLGFDLHHDHYARIIGDIYSGGIGWHPGDDAFTISENECLLVPVQFPWTVTVDRIGLMVHVQAGNIRTAIYADNGGTPGGGALIVGSGAVAVGPANNIQEVTIANTQVIPRLGWFAIWADQDGAAFAWPETNFRIPAGGTLIYHSFFAAFGAWPDPCPAVGDNDEAASMYARVLSTP